MSTPPPITRRERRALKRIKADFPYLGPLIDKVVQAAEASETLAEAAERRERDTAAELARARRRIAELETGPERRAHL